MEFTLPSNEGKMRIVQELVPGKQVTLAHIIASPDEIVYKKLGLNPALDYSKAAIGILSMSPAEISINPRSIFAVFTAISPAITEISAGLILKIPIAAFE